jgi:hypothetical protein
MKKVFFLVSTILCTSLLAQSQNQPGKKKESVLILETGVSSDWDFKSNYTSLSPTFGFEFRTLKEKLEVEVGATPYYSNSNYNWQLEMLIKKPYDISPQMEIMFGAGPKWTLSSEGNSASVDIVTDLMYWPFKKRIGFYFEPGYDYGLKNQHEQSLGISTGLIVGL